MLLHTLTQIMIHTLKALTNIVILVLVWCDSLWFLRIADMVFEIVM